MRVTVFLGFALYLASVAAAQEPPPGAEPRQAGRPITELLENLRDDLLPIPKPQAAEPLSVRDPAAHKVVLRVSEELFTSLIHRDIDQQTPVQDVILGTPVAGVARTVAQPRVDLIPHSSQAAFEVVMEGTTVTRTTGRNGPAVINSRGTTQFRAVKQVVFSPEKGFYALPSTVDARSQIVTESIGSTRGGLLGRLVRRRAWREVQNKRPQTLAIVQEKNKRRVAAVLDAEVNQGLARLNRRNEVRGLIAAVVSGTSQPRYACCSTEHYVQVGASLGPAGNRSIVLPPAEYLTSPVQLWIHRSLVRPQLPVILSRLGADRFDMSGFVSLVHVAPAAAVGAELLKTATTKVQESSPLDVQTIEDWMVVEIGNESRESRIVRR
jgi:hypothetical protein